MDPVSGWWYHEGVISSADILDIILTLSLRQKWLLDFLLVFKYRLMYQTEHWCFEDWHLLLGSQLCLEDGEVGILKCWWWNLHVVFSITQKIDSLSTECLKQCTPIKMYIQIFLNSLKIEQWTTCQDLYICRLQGVARHTSVLLAQFRLEEMENEKLLCVSDLHFH